jgi:hypothetical protein
MSNPNAIPVQGASNATEIAIALNSLAGFHLTSSNLPVATAPQMEIDENDDDSANAFADLLVITIDSLPRWSHVGLHLMETGGVNGVTFAVKARSGLGDTDGTLTLRGFAETVIAQPIAVGAGLGTFLFFSRPYTLIENLVIQFKSTVGGASGHGQVNVIGY